MTPTQQRTQEQVEVMLDFTKGRTIEFCRRDGSTEWTITKHPSWDWFLFEYRSMPGPRRCQTKFHPGRGDPWGTAWEPGEKHDASPHCEVLQMIELTPEVIKALEAAGIQWN